MLRMLTNYHPTIRKEKDGFLNLLTVNIYYLKIFHTNFEIRASPRAENEGFV